MGVEIPTPAGTGATILRVIKRNANNDDLVAARTTLIGKTFTDEPEEGTAAFATARLMIVDVCLDDLRRLVAVTQIVGAW